MSIYLNSKKIVKDWTDYNGHMNVAYYVLIFDIYGAEKLMSDFKMGEHSAKTTNKSTMVVESHITYNQEIKEGEEVDGEAAPAEAMACMPCSDCNLRQGARALTGP